MYHLSPSAALGLVSEGLPAVSQVCGYCSTEQKLGERCQHCDKRIARNAAGSLGAPSRHWEVGQGPPMGASSRLLTSVSHCVAPAVDSVRV